MSYRIQNYRYDEIGMLQCSSLTEHPAAIARVGCDNDTFSIFYRNNIL